MSKPDNSFEAVKFVLDRAPKDLTVVQRLVLVQIAHHYPNPHLSQKTLAAEIGVRRVDTVYKAIRVLAERKLLIVERQGHMKANKYSLNTRFTDTAQTAIMTTRQTAIHGTRQTAIKQTNIKKENKEVFCFSSEFGSDFFLKVSAARPDLSLSEVRDWLVWFEGNHAWHIENAHTEQKLLDKVLSFFPSAKGK